MADDYEIVTRIVIDDSASKTGARGVKQTIDGVEQHAKRAGSKISSIFGKALAFAGGLYGIKQLAGGIVGIHTEVQNAEGSLATLFSSLEGMTIGEALPFAREQVRLLNLDAAKGVGGLKDYQDAFTRLVAPARAAGAEFEQIRKLTKLGITAGFALGGSKGAQQLPMDIVQSLTGGAGEIITKNLNIALGAIGMTTTEFNKLEKAAKLEVLEEALSGFAAGAELMGQSWEAQTETLADAVKRIARTLTAPLFERWSGSLQTANAWLEKNEARIASIAEIAGGKMLDAWDNLIQKAGTYAAILAGIAMADHLPSSLGKSGGSRAGKKSGDVLSRLRIGGLFGKKGGAAAGGGIQMPTRGALGMGGAGNVLTKFGMSIVRIAGPAAIASTLLMSLSGALSEWPELWGMLVGLGAHLTSSFSMLGAAFGSLTDKGSILNMVGGALILVLSGIGLGFSALVRGAALVVEVLGIITTSLGSLFKMLLAGHTMLGAAMTGDVAGVTGAKQRLSAVNQQMGAGFDASSLRIQKILGLLPDADKKGKEDGDVITPGGGLGGLPAVPSGGHTYIDKVTVDARATINDDPARIAMGWGKVMDDLHRNPKSAKRASSPLVG